jgi:hypothetical protein
MVVGPTVLMVRNGTSTRVIAASSVKMSWSSVPEVFIVDAVRTSRSSSGCDTPIA